MTWPIWFIIAVVFAICEITTSSFFCLCLSVGSFFAAGSAYLFSSVWIEIIVFIIFSILSLYFISSFFKKIVKKSKTIESNVDSLIGAKAIVTSKIIPFNPGFVKVFGEIWRAESNVEVLEGEAVKIKRISGTTLTVEK
ncbi:MAG: NfeD family protein [Endomicrobium sp.]|jgi:membrane protein implicated in regulation of membrane protease activity|nr:NfeD family protein [Endomicrobium sp.]